MRIFTIFFLLFGSLFVYPALSQTTPWTSRNSGLYGGNITALLATGSFLFAGTYNDGIYVSPDNGANWTPANNGLPLEAHITSFASDGATIYAGSLFNGLYASTDNGATWKSIPIFNSSANNQITCLQLVGQNLFAGTSDGITLSTDNGKTSMSVSNGLPAWALSPYSSHGYVTTIAASGSSIFAGLVNGLYRSNDNGTTWVGLSNGIPSNADVTSFVVSGTTIIAGIIAPGTDWGVYLSNDNGDSWLHLTNADFFAYSLAVYGDKIFAGTPGSGLYYSSDNGSTWQNADVGTSAIESVNAMVVNGSSLYVGGSSNGIFATNDGGSSWAPANNGLTNENIQSMVNKDGKIFAATAFGKIYQSQDHGNSWLTVNDRIVPYQITSLHVMGDSLLATTDNNGVLFSIDEGLNWTSMNFNIAPYGPQVYDLLVHKNKIIVGSPLGVYQFQPGDNSWISLGTGLSQNALVTKLYQKDDIIFAGTRSNGLYYSKDDGATWLAQNIGTYAINTITSSGKYLVVPSDANIYLTQNDGTTWETITGGIGTYPFVTSFSVDSSYVFFGGDDDDVHFSTDHGHTTSLSNNGLPPIVKVLSFLQDGDMILAGTTEGVWAVPLAAFAPIINSFSPTSGSPGTLVTISATNFDRLPGYDSVKFNGIKADVISVAADSLVVKVPSGAITGPVSLTVAGRTAMSITEFCVGPEKPVITVSGLASAPLLTSSSATGNQWFLNGMAIAGAVDKTLNAAQPGLYTVQATGNGCPSSFSDGKSVSITEISPIYRNDLNLTIFPVPSHDKIMINLDQLNQGQDFGIHIYNSLGQEVYSRQSSGNDQLINISGYSHGVYIVKVILGNQQVTGKFIKM